MRRKMAEARDRTLRRLSLPKFISIIALALVFTVPSVSPSEGSTHADWIVVRYHNSYVSSNNWFSMDIRGHATGNDPVVFGYGLAQPDWNNAWVHPVRLGWGETSAALVVDSVGVKMQILPRPEGEFAAKVELAPHVGNPAVLVFVANGVIDHAVDNAPPGAVRRYGTGSSAVALDQAKGGAAVVAGPAGAAAGRGQAEVASGIVGGIESRSCAMCAGTWRSPNGTSRNWARVRTYTGHVWGAPDRPGVGPESFAGPAGQWMWSWVELGLIDPRYAALQMLQEGRPAVIGGSPVIAAWAPIGDDWTLWEAANEREIADAVGVTPPG